MERYFYPERKKTFATVVTLLPPLWEQSKNNASQDELFVMHLYLLLLKLKATQKLLVGKKTDLKDKSISEQEQKSFGFLPLGSPIRRFALLLLKFSCHIFKAVVKWNNLNYQRWSIKISSSYKANADLNLPQCQYPITDLNSMCLLNKGKKLPWTYFQV